MNNYKKLIELVQQNPELSVIPMVDGELCGDDYAWYVGSFGTARVGEYALYNDRWYDDRSDFKEAYYDYNDDALCEKFCYNPRINEYTTDAGKYTMEQYTENKKHEAELDEYLDGIAERKFKKAIIVYIGAAEMEDEDEG